MDEWKKQFRLQSLLKRKETIMSQLEVATGEHQHQLYFQLRAIEKQLAKS